MNKAYRLVWSRRHGCFVAVPEIACARGKSTALVCAATLTLASLFMTPAYAQVDVASGNTTVKCCSRLLYPLQFAKHAVCSFRYCLAFVRACVCVGAIIANC